MAERNRIRFLDKETEMHLMEQLFDLLYENMLPIAPSGLPYETEKQQWLSQVVPAMAKAPRQIVLIYDEDTLAGYLQYYINNGLFMVEEIQLRKDCRSTSLFASLWKFMSRIIPEDTRFIEAYADPRNHVSRHLMERLGMESVEDGPYPHLLHFRGSLDRIRRTQAKAGDYSPAFIMQIHHLSPKNNHLLKISCEKVLIPVSLGHRKEEPPCRLKSSSTQPPRKQRSSL